jgi:hypothetical protein
MSFVLCVWYPICVCRDSGVFMSVFLLRDSGVFMSVFLLRVVGFVCSCLVSSRIVGPGDMYVLSDLGQGDMYARGRLRSRCGAASFLM